MSEVIEEEKGLLKKKTKFGKYRMKIQLKLKQKNRCKWIFRIKQDDKYKVRLMPNSKRL